MSTLEVDFGTHNINGDGRPTNTWASPHRILATTETNEPGHHRPPVSRFTWNVWMPDEDPSLAISLSRRSRFLRGVDQDAVDVVRYHRSGAAEGWDGIATPARHAASRDNVVGDLEATTIVTHLINSGFPVRGSDRYTAKRREIWEDLEWPQLLALVERTQDRGRLVFLGGDFNRRDCPTPPGLRRLTGPGLDHLFVSQDRRILGGRTSAGPKTGTSGRVHHGSTTAHLKIRVKETRR